MKFFVGRKKQIEFLENVWNREHPGAGVITGRRRIGKTTLLEKFCEDKRSIFVRFLADSVEYNLSIISRAVSAMDGSEPRRYEDISDALTDILERCREAKTSVVFDEFPYIIATNPGIASAFQHLVDQSKHTGSLIIFCGSSRSIMRRETTDYDRPLYGRMSFNLELGPLTYLETREFHPHMNEVDCMRTYLTVGGSPKYHQDRESKTYENFIEKHFFSYGADFKDEAHNILSTEFTSSFEYMLIVNLISGGSTGLKEISEKSGIPKPTCIRKLDELKNNGIIGMKTSMFDSPKNPFYFINDHIVAFCQNIVRKTESGGPVTEKTAFKNLKQDIDTHLGNRFEMLYLEAVAQPGDCLQIGSWWKSTKDETWEIDIAAIKECDNGNYCLLVECKFRNRATEPPTIHELVENSRLVRTDLPKRLMIISREGFSSRAEEVAIDNDVELMNLEGLLKMLRMEPSNP